MNGGRALSFAWLYNGEGRRHAAGIELPQNCHVFVPMMCDDGLGDLRKSLRLFCVYRGFSELERAPGGLVGGYGRRQVVRERAHALEREDFSVWPSS